MKILAALSLLFFLGGLGCMSISERITPAEIDPKAVDYAIDSGVSEPNEYEGYPNLLKAKRLKKDVDSAHKVNQFDLQQMIEKDKLDYSLHRDVASENLLASQQWEEMLFGEQGLIALGLSLAGVGGLAGIYGWTRKRPNDRTPEEFNSAVEEVKAEVTTKNKQIAEIVKGVQGFLDKTEGDTGEGLKTFLSKYQSADTKEEIAKIKANI
jgi:hypothetical protein